MSRVPTLSTEKTYSPVQSSRSSANYSCRVRLRQHFAVLLVCGSLLCFGGPRPAPAEPQLSWSSPNTPLGDVVGAVVFTANTAGELDFTVYEPRPTALRSTPDFSTRVPDYFL